MSKDATRELIALAKRLTPCGEIGDGMVARFHELAGRAELEYEADAVARLRTEPRP